MGLRGIGIDVADVRRIGRLVERHGRRFTQRWFVPEEVAQCEGSESPTHDFAARFAAKEAVWKSLGLAWEGGRVPWRSIMILRAGAGLTVDLVGDVAAAARSVGASRICIVVSIRDDRALAVAMAESGELDRPQDALNLMASWVVPLG